LALRTKFQSLLRLLPELYVAALDLPDVEPTDRDFDLPAQKLQIDFGEIAWYKEIFDPYEMEDQPVTGDLVDDLMDIYSDVKRGLLIYEQGTPDDKVDAVWHWKFDFGAHWGFHLVDAIRAMHWALQRFYTDI
jgi:hypothetical protein